jgi:poly-gamma-glutamate capsule biosynthesis protein CapA/YwtB (metallophosphatase superfamily)
MARRRWVAGVVLVTVVAGAPACSADDPPPVSAPTSSPTSTSTSTAEPATTPPEDVEPPTPPPVTRLLVVGDIMLGRGVAVPEAPVQPLRYLAGRIGRADIAVGNLESTLSDDGEPQQDPVTDSFAAPPGTLAGLERLGFDALSLANNHTGDFGPVAFDDTLRAFRGRRVQAFGAGRDLARASRAAVVRRHGVSFGFVGFNAIGETPRATRRSAGALSVRMPPRTGPLNRADLDHVTGVVGRLAERVDVVVVIPHWGDQYTHAAEPVQSEVGRALVRAGADLVVGGHPHWVQGLEPVGRAVIAHSLGNLVFDMDFMEQTMEGVSLVATFRGDRLVDVALQPYRMGPDFAPRPVRGEVAAGILADVRSASFGRFGT